MKPATLILTACFCVNAMATTLIRETWNGVNAGEPLELKNPSETSSLKLPVPGADQFHVIKLDESYHHGDFSNQSLRGSDGMAFHKFLQGTGSSTTADYAEILDFTKKGYLTMTFDYRFIPTSAEDKGMNPGYFGFEGIDAKSNYIVSFKFRPTSRSDMPVLVFFRHDEPIFGTKELVSSLGPVNRDSPVIHAHCVLAYNQTEGMMDVELGFSVGDGPRQVTTMKGIPLPDFPQSNRMKLDAWHPTRFWMDTIVLENELGTYEVEE